MRNQLNDLPEAIERILSHPSATSFRALRDRAAYIFITGCMPTHLHPETYELLLLVSEVSRGATSLDGRSGAFVIIEEAATRLNLDSHPMVAKVRELLVDG